jgi:hypothetical protein
MAGMKVRDAELRNAIQSLGAAQKRGNAGEVRARRREVASRSRTLQREAERSAREQINAINGIALVGGAVVVVILLAYLDPWEATVKDTRRALGWAAVVVFGFYAGLGLLRWRDGGLLSFIRGKDGRLSTSLLQVGLWTVAVSSALVYFIFLAFYSDDPGKTFKDALGGDNLPEAYLLLLGGPFAAAVIARMSIGSKVEDQEVQKVKGNAKLLDVIADDDAQANLVDAQFLIFNLVALTWFGTALFHAPTALPAIPDLLVGLTSTSAIAYTAAKGVASNRPIVTSVTRYLEEAASGAGAIRPGDFVEIRGLNFVPDGAASEELLGRIVVKFGDRHASPRFILDDQGRVRSPADDWMVARVPTATVPGTVLVSVVTAAGIEAESRDIAVVEDKPIVTGLRRPAEAPGSSLRVLGRFLRVAEPSDSDLPSVRFGSTIVQADSLDEEGLDVTVPDHLKPGKVDLSVRAAGGTTWSDSVPFTVLRRRGRVAALRKRPRK